MSGLLRRIVNLATSGQTSTMNQNGHHEPKWSVVPSEQSVPGSIDADNTDPMQVELSLGL